ncbi:MAG: FlgD immunoglobulin-like domain containing protein [bacterium]|nr:T9SS type A sorting domain-containing protein [candidate division KSB1 bacterium]MDH7559448.1 FlgD immunoglobulin-like domain containing protein [bacterium]
MTSARSWLRPLVLVGLASWVVPAGSQWIYFRNFVRHADGQFCRHQPPEASFTVFLNGDESRILLENAPRWDTGGDPNIDGKGTFGVELGNFSPAVAMGDCVVVRFCCEAAGEQGVLAERIDAIPWYRWPSTLYLAKVQMPARPRGLRLHRNIRGHRELTWEAIPNATYAVYRRALQDTVAGGLARRQYQLMAEGLFTSSFTDSAVAPGASYGYVVFARSSSGTWGPHSEEVNEIVAGADLDVGWIARLPRLSYVWGSSDPAVEGWPRPGELVTWRAHIRNWAAEDMSAVPYAWLLDGEEVARGLVDLPDSGMATVDYSSPWTFARHELEFVIDPDNEVPEEEEGNNAVLIYTNALSVGFYVEQSVYDYFHRYQKELGVHANSWEDWAQRHVRRWNQMFANAVYPETPEGVLDRLRIDHITVVPDGRLPLAGGLATNTPNLQDRTVDLQWGFPASLLTSGFYANHKSISDSNPFFFEGSLLHELGHARYLIDLYGFNVHDNGSGSTVAIMEGGRLIVGTPYMPLVGGDAVHYTPYKGLMNGEYTWIDRYSAVALNLIAGHRATKGNYNAPENIGAFMQDLPLENCLTVKDNGGNPLPGAQVSVYRATGQPGVWYGKYFDDKADMLLFADDAGNVYLGRCPFSATGVIVHDYGLSNAVLIVRVEHGGGVGYGFLESTDFNMEYWRGHIEVGRHELRVNLVPKTTVLTASGEEPQTTCTLSIAFPNPFNQSTEFAYSTTGQGQTQVAIFDVSGRLIRTLIAQELPAGTYRVQWDGKDQYGLAAPTGVYWCRLTNGMLVRRQQVTLVR